jgi:hypothetical protein
MRDRHAAIAWDRSTAQQVPPPLRPVLGALWRDRATSEHRSIGIFALYTLDLMGAGVPPAVLSHACRASLDEVRHAELFTRLAALYSGEEVAPPPGIPPMPDIPSMTMREQVAREALHLGVMSETYSSVSLTAIRDRATDPVVRQVLGVVLADEVHHARMGWAFVAHLLEEDPAIRPFLDAELGPMFASYVDGVFGDPDALPESSVSADDRPLAEAHGYESIRDSFVLWVDTLRDVWVPGLTGLGLSAGGLIERYAASAARYRPT